MKRFLAGLVAGVVLAAAPLALAENSPIRLYVDGKEVLSPDAPPQVINGRTMIPARPLAEALGAKVEWDDATKTVYVTSAPLIIKEPAVVATVETVPVYVEYNRLVAVLASKYKDVWSSKGWIKVDGVVYSAAASVKDGVMHIDASQLLANGIIASDDLKQQEPVTPASSTTEPLYLSKFDIVRSFEAQYTRELPVFTVDGLEFRRVQYKLDSITENGIVKLNIAPLLDAGILRAGGLVK